MVSAVSFSLGNLHDQVAGAIFLVDIYCLGVKDVITMIGPEWKWNERLQQQRDSGRRLDKISPEAARKLVEGSVEYARSPGIAPHRDWIHASPIFGDVDASLCLTEFEFGKDGKPLFVAGPYDTPERVQQIMSALANSTGEGNYHYMLPTGEDELFLGEDDDDDDEFEDADDMDDIMAITDERSQTDSRAGTPLRSCHGDEAIQIVKDLSNTQIESIACSCCLQRAASPLNRLAQTFDGQVYRSSGLKNWLSRKHHLPIRQTNICWLSMRQTPALSTTQQRGEAVAQIMTP